MCSDKIIVNTNTINIFYEFVQLCELALCKKNLIINTANSLKIIIES